MPPNGPDVEAIRSLAGQSQQALGELREQLRAADGDRRERLDRLGDEATRLVEQLASQIAGELSEDLANEYSEKIAVSREELEAEREALHAQRDEWLAEKANWENVRDQVEAELSQREEKLAADMASSDGGGGGDEGDEVLLEKLEHARAEQELAEQQAELMQSHVGELTAALEEASEQLAAVGEIEEELNTLRGKFDLALADLGSHREHVAALEEELAARPDAAASESSQAELNQLRAERDDLAQRLEELANQTPPEDSSEELNDLRTRFEMAVEDVRELKTENDELREKLASSAASLASTDGNDWEAQKARLLASLDGEGDTDDQHRQEERATIAGTIQITDEVVAEKDREIERLLETIQASLDEDHAGGSDEEPSAAHEELLGADEVIRNERERLAQLEAEVQEKLRQAELELSVERAKNSRAQAELAEQGVELETLRAATGAAAGGESKRRWMDKLGLGGE